MCGNNPSKKIRFIIMITLRLTLFEVLSGIVSIDAQLLSSCQRALTTLKKVVCCVNRLLIGRCHNHGEHHVLVLLLIAFITAITVVGLNQILGLG